MVVATTVAGVATGRAALAFTSSTVGTTPPCAAAIAGSAASMHASEPSVVTTYRRSSRYCIDSAEPQPVPSFHRRVPSAAKQ